ncbi:MAG: hypothetical protein WBA45_14670 [Microthrixaceae bacterium]
MSVSALRRSRVSILLVAVAVAVAVGCVPPPDDGGTEPTSSCDKIVEHPLASGTSWAARSSVSADGSRIAFIRDGRIIVREVATSVERDITGDLAVGLPVGTLQISTDGGQVGVTLPGIVGANRDGYLIDVDTAESTRLDWSGFDWTTDMVGVGFSGDLSAFVFAQASSSKYWVVAGDGSPARSVTLDATWDTRLNRDASVIASGLKVNVRGTVHTYDGPDAATAVVVDLDASGDRALVTSSGKAYFWYLATGSVEALPMAPGEAFSGPGWARASDDGRFVVRSGSPANGDWGVRRFDLLTGEVTPLPRIFDGVTGISNDGRVITSTNASYFRCAD